MPRLFLAVATAGFLATSAEAAPSLGGSKAGVKEQTSPIAFLLSFIDFRMAGKAAPISDGEHDSKKSHYDCEDAKTAEADQDAEKKDVNPSGPEPVYLAF